MPTFFPKIPAIFAISISSQRGVFAIGWGSFGVGQRPTTEDQRLLMRFLAEGLDFHVHASRQIEFHQRIYGLRRGLENIEQTLMRTNLELLARFLVDVRRTQHAILILHRGQWNRARDLRSRTTRRLDDLTGRLVKNAVVVRF